MRFSRRDIAVIVTLAAVYFLAGRLGLRLAFAHPSATPVWPPTGISLAAVLIFGYRVWPGILAGAFLANVTTAGSPATSLAIATGNTLEALLAAYLLRRYVGGRQAFHHAPSIFRFTLWIVPISVAVSATCGVTALSLGGHAHWSDYSSIWMTWWLGDAAGALIVTPFLVLWAARPRPTWTWARALEAAGLAVVLLLFASLVFGSLGPVDFIGYPLGFLSIPCLMWAAFRLGPREAAACLIVLSAIAIRGTLLGYGPFIRGTPNESLLLLQAFLVVCSVMTLAVSALVAEHRRAEDEIRLLNLGLEQQVEQRTAELARTNAELQAFTDSVSHDLRAPIRHIATFADFLLEECAAQLDEHASEYIDQIRHACNRMSRLVDDLLRLSRVGHHPLVRRPTDLRALAEEVLGELTPEPGARAVEWHVAPLPVLSCDPGLIKIALSNLLSNALKFTRPKERAVIRIGEAAVEGGPAIFVRDNGVGFDMKQADRLFAVFQRLHADERFEGTGVGLATVQRIILRHGGRIWADASPDRGATFYFTLGPAAGTTAANSPSSPADGSP